MGDAAESPYIDFVEKAEHTARLGTGIAGLFYIMGLIIDSMYLSEYGIHSFSQFEVVYLLSGFSFCVFLAVPFLTVSLPWCYTGGCLSKRLAAFAALIPLAALVNGFLLAILFGFTYKGIMRNIVQAWAMYLRGRIFIFVAAVYLYAFILYRRVRNRAGKGFTPIGLFAGSKSLVILILCLGLSLLWYTLYIHPEVDAGFGGGLCGRFDIKICTENKADVENMMLDVDDQGYVRAVLIVHEDSSYYYIGSESALDQRIKCTRLPKEFTSGLLHIKFRKEKWMNNKIQGNQSKIKDIFP